jgi:RNA polymerase sigma-70 factor (ECF subfamily)
MEQMLERQLLRRLAAGEVEALGPLYDAYGRRVYHLLLAYGLDDVAAEDALQETFLALLDRGRAAARIENVQAYLLGIARRQAGGRRRRLESEPLADDAGGAVADGAPARLDMLTCRQRLSQLPPEQAEVVVLKVWHDLTFAEIAAALRIPANTAASRYRYAIEKLRGMWGEDDDAGRTA